MNDPLFHLSFGSLEVVVTAWKLIGYLGLLLFTGRWVVQLIASRRAGMPVLPRAFWYMSMSGSVLLLAYFTFGKNDSVGVLANLFPLVTAGYNLWLDLRLDLRPALGRWWGRTEPRWRGASLLGAKFVREVAALVRRRRGEIGGAVLAVLALAATLHGFDAGLRAWNTRHVDATMISWARSLSWWGELHRAPLLALVAVSLHAALRRRKDVSRLLLSGLAAGLAAGVLVNILKVIVARPRPSSGLADGFYWFHFESAFLGFPSGHAAHCFAMVGALFVFAPRWAGALVGGAAAVAWARFCLDRHYLTDLVAGAGLGLMVGVVCGLAAQRTLAPSVSPNVAAAPPQPAPGVA